MALAELLIIDRAPAHGVIQNTFDDAREVGHFSLDAERKIHFDRSQMKYYVPRRKRNLSLDLNVGYEDLAQGNYEAGASLTNLFKWIKSTNFNSLNRDLDFVCSRGVIQKLLGTPYSLSPSDSWITCASRFDDVIYLQSIETPDHMQYEMNRTDWQKRWTSWGYRFEQYITADEPDGVPDVSSNTHEIEEFCIVVTNRMGPYNMLIRAETDGVDTREAARPGSGDTSCYVEIKTSKAYPNFRSSYQVKKFKSLRWWTQSVIVGIEKNICGVRDEKGIVRSIEEFRTSELPILSQGSWNPNGCFKFCNNFLKYLKSTLNENDHRIVYKFEYSGGPRVSVTRLDNPEGQHRVIPDWYVESYRRPRTDDQR